MLIANRYEATGAASWGGMAEVHKFVDLHLSRTVMLKRIPKIADASRLVDEQNALLSIRSKHVVQLLDVVEYDYAGVKERGLILEHIEGNDLSEGTYKKDGAFIHTLWQVASGLSDIHSSGIIHRDIKPPNIRMDQSGVVKIIDFGLSREIGKDDKTMSVIGSLGYIAPELKSGPAPIRFTKAVDVFAFGVTALALLVPISKQDGVGSPKLAEEILDGFDDNVVEVISRSLKNNSSKRPSIIEIRDVLGSVLLKSQHRAWLNNEGKLTEINASAPSAKINAGIGSIEIEYTGTTFLVKAVSGAVSINNLPIAAGQTMPLSCVLIFGSQGASSRAFVTFDSSNPEVMA